jgi:DNA (cytosine-5)-methyltransferase 1
MGYHRAGFTVVGIDIDPQSEYPFEFHQADALAFLREHGHKFAAVHASPPCHDHSTLSSLSGMDGTADLLDATREALARLPQPWVIENVAGARGAMREPLRLCGTEFGLQAEGWWLARHRLFESNVPLWGAGGCHCAGRKIAGVYGHSDGPVYKEGRKGWSAPSPLARELLGTPWITNRHALAQAIPPAFTEFIGEQLLSAVTEVAA